MESNIISSKFIPIENTGLQVYALSNAQIFLLNDNNGKLFDFAQDWETGAWVSPEIHKQNGPAAKFSNEKIESAGLLADKNTGILSVRLTAVPEYLDLDPSRASVKSAYISMGYLLRKAACAYLDIDLSELDVNFRVVSGQDCKLGGEIFFSDSMENGSGFCQFLFDQRHNFRQKLLDIFIDKKSDNALKKMFEKHKCFLACYDCIKDYGNLHYHGDLNWRLGLDMIYLAQDLTNKIDFNLSHWESFVLQYKLNVESSSGALLDHTNQIIITHPLWTDMYVQALKAENHVETYKPVQIFAYVAEGPTT